MNIPGFKHIYVAGQESKETILGRRDGTIKSIALPWKKLNQNYLLDGIEWGSMATWAGMSSSGKSAILAQIVEEVEDSNKEQNFITAVFSFEMPASKMVMRNIITSTEITREYLLSAHGHIIEDYQLKQIDSYLQSLKDKNIYFWEKPVTPKEYIKAIKKIYEETGKKVLALSDHSLLFKGEASDKERATLVDLSLEIMELKNEGWNSHIVFSQLNREIEKVERRTPNSPLNYPGKGDIFASDALYQASDYVFVIHRPYLLKFNPNTYGPGKDATEPHSTYMHVLKSREGNIGMARMLADFKTMKIKDL